MSIRKILQAIEETDEQILIDAYSEMLEVAYLHLLNFAAVLHHDPFGYVAQILDQSTVDSVLIEVIKMNAENFEINSGLNDAWHEPTTNGQGFFLMVYPESATVFLGWFTYDVEFPGQEARASLGDTCQRWLTAQGSFDGAQAELVVYNSSGGLFNSTLPVPGLEPIGSITLQFEDCENGSVSYDLPGIGVSGLIPIERVASDNVAACVVQAYPIN